MKKLSLIAILLALFSCTLSQGSSHKKKGDARKISSEYSREEFKWRDSDHDCQNTRQEILIERSLKPVTYRTSKRGDCTVMKGEWKDFYYDEVLEKAADIDIDHVVPIKHAWDLGASDWSSEEKSEFGNDPENLVITNLKYNRQKGPLTISEWLPVNRGYACRYVARWFKIKEKYKLPISEEEQSTRDRLKCETVALPTG